MHPVPDSFIHNAQTVFRRWWIDCGPPTVAFSPRYQEMTDCHRKAWGTWVLWLSAGLPSKGCTLHDFGSMSAECGGSGRAAFGPSGCLKRNVHVGHCDGRSAHMCQSLWRMPLGEPYCKLGPQSVMICGSGFISGNKCTVRRCGNTRGDGGVLRESRKLWTLAQFFVWT